MTEKQAIALPKSKLRGFHVQKKKDLPYFFIFMCTSLNPKMIPNKIAVVINKENGKIGSSIASIEDAVRQAQ